MGSERLPALLCHMLQYTMRMVTPAVKTLICTLSDASHISSGSQLVLLYAWNTAIHGSHLTQNLEFVSLCEA